MIVLGLDSATVAASVAVVNDECLLGEITINTRKNHSQRLLPLIDRLLADTGVELPDLSGLAVTNGPGSFTGLRIGLATAKGLAQVLKLPVTPVCTLDVLANNLLGQPGLICPILDARKSEVYTATYRSGTAGMVRQGAYLAVPPEELAAELQITGEPVTFLGDAVAVYQDFFREQLGGQAAFAGPELLAPRAGWVARLGYRLLTDGGGENFHQVKPFYIRLSEAEARRAGICHRGRVEG